MGWPWRTCTLLGSESAWKAPHGFHDANSYKQEALPNSGNTCGQLGGWTFLDMHTHTKLKKALKMSLLKSQVQVENIARLSTRDTLSLRWDVGGVQVGGMGTPFLFPTFAIWVIV